MDDSEDFRPRLGRMGSPRGKRGQRYLAQVIRSAARAGAGPRTRGRSWPCGRIGRGAGIGRLLGSRDRFAGSRGRWAIVKTRLVRLRGDLGHVPPPVARAAYRAYGPHHPRLPLLAHDLAHDWMLQGRFAPALQVFQALLPKFHDPAERVPALADLARAAGGAADRGAFERAWDELWPLAHERAGEAVAARALLDLAHGAASLGEWTRAETAAGESRQMAERRGEGKVAAEAESVLESVRAKRAVESTLARSPEGEEEAEGFAGDLVRVLGNAR